MGQSSSRHCPALASHFIQNRVQLACHGRASSMFTSPAPACLSCVLLSQCYCLGVLFFLVLWCEAWQGARINVSVDLRLWHYKVLLMQLDNMYLLVFFTVVHCHV